MADPGSVLTLDIEKPAAGGRMLARHHGQVVFVSAAIPGECVRARVERVTKGLLFAETIEVLTPSPDRRATAGDWRCGGNVLSHVAYPRQLALKAEILRDAFARIARVPLAEAPHVLGSPETGYRMRARLHVHDGRIGFYREGTHHLCDAAQTGQLLPSTGAWLARAEAALAAMPASVYGGVAAIEIAETIPGDARACHLELHAGVDVSRYSPLADGLSGLSAQRADSPTVEQLAGTPAVVDTVPLADEEGSPRLRLQRDVRAFFQGNRFLLEPFVQRVASLVPAGPVLDLYAGVGLFGLALAALGRGPVTLVEGDPIGGADLVANARPLAASVQVHRLSVEEYLRAAGPCAPGTTAIVDPPRTGLSKEAIAGVIDAQPTTIVYVSCDVATLARDTRLLLEAGFELGDITGVDLFPNTAHVESVVRFHRAI